jgi:hypothetical protein
MKIKTPAINVDNTQTDVDGQMNFSLKGDLASEGSVPSIKVDINIPKIWIDIRAARVATGEYRLSGVINPFHEGMGYTHTIWSDIKDYKPPPITISSDLVKLILNAVLSGTGNAKLD